MMTYILFVYLSTFASQGGVSITSAEFKDLLSCQQAAEKITEEFKTFFVQPAKTLCLPNEQIKS